MTEAQLAEALRVLAAALVARREAAPAPAQLVRIDGPTLEGLGLELRGVLALVREGKLRTIKIGRGRFTTTNHLAALVDDLDAAPPPMAAAHDEPANDLAAAVAKASKRRSRRSAA